MTAPAGLQLDLLTMIGRLEQIRDECTQDDGELTGLGSYLLHERIIGCDVPRLRRYLTPETIAWENESRAELEHRGQPA